MDNPDWMFFIPLLSDFWVLRALGYGSLLIQSAVIPFYFIRWKFMFGGGLHRSQIFISLFMFFVLYVLRRRYLACSALSKGFGKGIGFSFGLFFLPIIFIQILGFGKAKWKRNEEKWKSVHAPSGYTQEKKHSALLLDKEKGERISESQSASESSKWKKAKNQTFSFVWFLDKLLINSVSFLKNKVNTRSASKKPLLWVLWAGGILLLGLLWWLGWREYQIYLANKGASPADCFTAQQINIAGKEGLEILSYDVKNCGKEPVIPWYLERKQVLAIGSGAFDTQGLLSVALPEGVVEVKDDAFRWNELTSLIFPKTLKLIWTGAFVSNWVHSIKFSEWLEKIWALSFAFNQLSWLVFPSSLKEVDFAAFAHNKMTSIVFSDGLEKIWDSSFSGNLLISVSFPDSVKVIWRGAFQNNGLTSIKLPLKLEMIDNEVFQHNQLQSVVFPEWLKSIWDSAFLNNKLTSVSFPNSLQSVWKAAFAKNKISSLEFWRWLKEIGMLAFDSNQLSELRFPEWLEKIWIQAFNNNQLSSLMLPEGVKQISMFAFSNNKLISLKIPGSVKKIELSAFARNSISSLELGDGVESIAPWAFAENRLTQVVFPDSIKELNYGAFLDNEIVKVKFPHKNLCIDSSVFWLNKLSSYELLQIYNKLPYCSPWGRSSDIDLLTDSSRSVRG